MADPERAAAARAYWRAKSYRQHKAKGGLTMAEFHAGRAPDVCTVEGCDRPYLAKGECKLHYGRTQRAAGNPAYAHTDYRRRCERGGGEFFQLDRLQIFERDEYVCGICSLPVDRAAKAPDPDSPSLDHIIPLSKGGDHSEANTQCSHLRCNVLKGAGE